MAKMNINAQQAIGEIKALIDYLEKLRTTASKVGSANAQSFRVLDDALRSLISTTTSINTAFSEMANQLRKAEIQKKRFVTQSRNLSQANKLLIQQNQLLIAQNARQQAGTKQLGNGIMGLINNVRGLIGAFGIVSGIQLFANIIRSAFETIKTFDAIGFAMAKITENSFDYAVSQRFLIEITRDFGADLVATSNRWIKFLAAAKQSGMTLRDTENIFRSMTKTAGVLGLATHELTGIYLALEQMLSKGKVTTEELRRQLGERLPGAMGIMAASMGVTLVQLDKMLKKGEVLSAEVLPNFAKAVEVAFGIESTEKVETLTAAQNKLGNAWKMFIKNIFEGNNFLRGVFDGLRKDLELLISVFGSAQQKRELLIIGKSKEFRKEMLDIAIKAWDKEQKIGEKFADIEAQIERKKNEISLNNDKANKKDKEDILEEEMRVLVDRKLKALAVIEELEKKDADNKIENAVRNFNIYKAIIEKNEKTLLDEQAKGYGNGKMYATQIMEIVSDEVLQARKVLIANTPYLVEWTAKLEELRKLRETSKSPTFTDDEDGDKDKMQKNLREVADLKEQIEIGNLKKAIENRKIEIESEETFYEEKLVLAKQNQVDLDRIAQLGLQEAVRNIKEKAEEEKKTNAEAVARGRLSAQLNAEQNLKIDEETRQKIALANQKAEAEVLQNKEDNLMEQLTLKNNYRKREQDLIKAEYDELIYLENQRWDAQDDAYKLDVNNKKEHDDAINRLNHNAHQAQLQWLLTELELEKQVLEARGENVKWLDAIIKEVKAQLKDFDEGGDLEKAEKQRLESLRTLIQMANEAVQAVGDIFASVFDKRIEFINKEINAEKNKFEKLIELASNDEEQRNALAKQRDDRIRILENRRLKEEQKQAKIRKAFAVADIAAKLAQTIVAINLAAVNQDVLTPFAFGLTGAQYRLVQIALAVGAAVAQTAAVLSAPIPQYAKGGSISKAHVGMINDAGVTEYVERGSSILTAPNKNAIVDLKPGDIVHKDFESLTKNSILMSAMLGGRSIDEKQFSKMFTGIEQSIDRGFKKAKINNNIRLSDKRKDTSYGDSLSRWSN